MPDASATLPWCFDEEATLVTESLLDRLKTGDAAVVPAHWPAEIANSILMAVRRGKISQDRRDEFVRELLLLPIDVDPVSPATWFVRSLPLAEKHRLTVYDAAYLELALRRGLPLATLDNDLRRAAEAEGVGLLC